MNAIQPAISSIDDQPEIQQRPPDTSAVQGTREKLLSLVFSGSETSEETQERLLNGVYGYMERNFCFSRNELPQNEILNIVRVYQTGVAEDHYLRSQDGLSPEIIGKIVASSKSGRIPPVALNSIFLKPKTGKGLLQTAIKNYISLKHWSPLSNSELNSVIEDLFSQLTVSCEAEKTLEERLFANLTINDHNKKYRQNVDAPKIKDIKEKRKHALKEMAKLISWPYKENKLALTDEIMGQFFERTDGKVATTPFENEFLTTYFDSAQFGLGNRLLTEAADNLAYDRNIDFINYVYHFRRMISEYVLCRPYDRGLFLTESGMDAAKMLFSQWTKKGDQVLAVNQEYEPLLDWLEKEKEVRIIRLEKRMKDPEYKYEIEDYLSSGDVSIVLISDLSRFGTIFPFHRFKDLLSQKDRGFRLVVDACQSIGRKVLDYHGVPVDAGIGSCQKGSEVGEPVGLVAMEPDLAQTDFYDLKDMEHRGSANLPRLARVGIACCPELLGRLSRQRGVDDLDLKKMTASMQERDSSIKDLSYKFISLVDWINRKANDRIEILNPSFLHYPDGKIDPAQLGGIFELKIDGVSSQQIESMADDYGLTINDYTGASWPGHSIRIALHPFMNDQAIKMLGFVLMKCCEM